MDETNKKANAMWNAMVRNSKKNAQIRPVVCPISMASEQIKECTPTCKFFIEPKECLLATYLHQALCQKTEQATAKLDTSHGSSYQVAVLCLGTLGKQLQLLFKRSLNLRPAHPVHLLPSLRDYYMSFKNSCREKTCCSHDFFLDTAFKMSYNDFAREVNICER